MAKVIDLTESDGDLVVLGRSIVLPNSEVDSQPSPLNGAIRFNPTIGKAQIFFEGGWSVLGDGGSGDAGDGTSNNHTHLISQILGLQGALSGKASLVHTHTISSVTGLTVALSGKAPVAHQHVIADTSELQATLDAKANSVHHHLFAEKEKISAFLPGNPPSLFKLVWTATEPVTVPAGLLGSQFKVLIAPSASYAITLYKNNTINVGMITISPGPVFTITVAAFSLIAGDTLTFSLPPRDSSIDTISFTVVADRVPSETGSAISGGGPTVFDFVENPDLRAVQTPLPVTFDRYLDTVTGSNTNTGLSPNKPKKTMEAVLGMGSTNGIAIGIARGSRLGGYVLTGDNIRIGSYGAIGTPPPVFDPSILLPSNAWTPHGTYSGIWLQSVGGGYIDSNLKNIGNVVWLDQSTGRYEILKQYASAASLNSASKGVYVDGWNTVTLTVYIKPGAALGSPITNGQEYRVTNGYALRVVGTNAIVEDVTVQNAAQQNGSIDIGQGSQGGTARRVSSLNGSRHTSLFGENALVEDCYFYGGDNQLESGQGGNAIVFFTVDWAGKNFVVRRSIFDSSDDGSIAILSHDVANTGPMSPVLIEDCKFIGAYMTVTIPVTGSVANIVRPMYVNSGHGQINYQISTTSFNSYYAKGKLNMISDNAVSAVMQLFDSDLHLVDLGRGARQSAFYYAATTNGPVVRIVRGTYTIDPVIRGYSGHGTAVASLNSGSFYASGATFKIADDYILGHGLNFGWEIGFASGTGLVTGGNNRWPYGVKFYRNGTTYASLAAVQTAGYEAGSTSAPLPTALVSTDFSTIANGNLEGVSGWSKIVGPTGRFAVASNKVVVTTGATGIYKRGDLPEEGGFIRFKIEGFLDYSFVTQKMTLSGDNYLGCMIDATGHVAVYYVTPLTYNRPIYTAQAYAVGDVVLFATRVLDTITGNIGLWLYINDELISYAEYTNPTIAAATGVGCASFGAAGTLFSDFSAGPLK